MGKEYYIDIGAMSHEEAMAVLKEWKQNKVPLQALDPVTRVQTRMSWLVVAAIVIFMLWSLTGCAVTRQIDYFCSSKCSKWYQVQPAINDAEYSAWLMSEPNCGCEGNLN